MKKEIPKKTFIVLAFIVILTSCRDRKIILPDLPYLVADSVMEFKVGDRFILATSENSCCQYFWVDKSGIEYNLPEIEIIKNVETISDEADPDCAGCSSYIYRIYECSKPGSDSIVYAVIPAGDDEILEKITQFYDADSLEITEQQNNSQWFSELEANGYLRVFRFVIQNIH